MDIVDIFKSGAEVQIVTTTSQMRDFAKVVSEEIGLITPKLNVPDKPISEAEACKLYNKVRQTFSKYRKQGKIRYHVIGGSIVYFTNELEEDMKKL